MKRILIVDDEQDMHVLIKNILGKDKYDYDIAENGLEGYKKALNIEPDLMILDVQMPEMDGFGMLKKLIGEKKSLNFPVIFLTGIAEKRGAHFTEADVQDYYKNEQISYVEKPLDADKFKALVSEKI